MGKASRHKRERREAGRRQGAGSLPRPAVSPAGDHRWHSTNGPRTRVVAIDDQWNDLDDQVARLLEANRGTPLAPVVSPLGNVLDGAAGADSWSDVAAAIKRCKVPALLEALTPGPFAARATLAAARAAEGLQLLESGGLNEVRRMGAVPAAAYVFAPWRAISGTGYFTMIQRARRAGAPTPAAPALGFSALYLATPGLRITIETDPGDDDRPIVLPDPLVLAGFAEPLVILPHTLADEAAVAAELSLAGERAATIASPARTGGFYELGGRVEAAILVGGEHNELTDTVLWIVRPDRDATDLSRMQQEQRRILLGRLDRAGLAPAARSLARLVAQPALWEVTDGV